MQVEIIMRQLTQFPDAAVAAQRKFAAATTARMCYADLRDQGVYGGTDIWRARWTSTLQTGL